MSKITYPVAKDASCVKHCPECGRVHTGRAAVLPGEPGAVCLDCYKQKTGSYPLPCPPSPPAGPVPIPYPNVGKASAKAAAPPGKLTNHMGSFVKVSHGDEAGTRALRSSAGKLAVRGGARVVPR
jgi:hypothetical protein